jgi:hypothetical protein
MINIRDVNGGKLGVCKLNIIALCDPANLFTYYLFMGTAVAQWLRYCTTNQKVAGSIPDGVKEIFIDINPSYRNIALGSPQPLTEMSTRNISWG